MIRTFKTHEIRNQIELTNKLWDFSPCEGDLAEKVYQVSTPSCWETYPNFSNYRGEAIYSTHFFAEGNIRLEFKGVSHTATIFLDGLEIGSHYNAYTSFSLIVRNLKRGEHLLEVKADNRFSNESALHIPNDYMSYGGISRPIVLEMIGDLYIQSMQITPFKEKSKWKLEVELLVNNIGTKKERVDLEINIAGQSIKWADIEVDKQSDKKVTQQVSYENINEWSPESPDLYYAKATIYKHGDAVDDLIDRFGFREVSIVENSILLNRKKLRIKGLCRHEDHPQFGCALPYAAIEYDLKIAEHLGANSLRTAHYPNDEVFLDLCDEKGILVWEENHARGLSLKDMQNPNFQKQAENVIKEMIPLHYNHPSIFIWGILNECASHTEYGKECYQRQFELIKKLDQSRPHSFASCQFKTDICFGLPDIVSYNIYPLWYHDTPAKEYLSDLYQWVQEKTDGRGKPFIVSEIGAGAIYGYRNPQNSKWTEDYQAAALKEQIKACMEQPGCSGVYLWQFCDIRVSDEWFGGRPRTMNNKGIVDEYRRRKLAYDVVKQAFESYSSYIEIE